MRKFNVWFKFFSSNSRILILLALTCLMCMIIVSLGYLFYYNSKEIIRSEASEPQQHLLQIDAESIDGILEELNIKAIKTLVDHKTLNFLNKDHLGFYEDVMNYINYLDNLTAHPAIESIFVYDSVHHRVLGSRNYGYYLNADDFPDMDWIEDKDEIMNKLLIIKKRKIQNPILNKDEEKISLFRPLIIKKEVLGIVVINLDSDYLFSKLYPDDSSQIKRLRFIVSEYDQPIYELAANGSDIDMEHIYNDILKEDQNGSDQVKFAGETYLLSQVESPLTGWKYISLVSEGFLLKELNLIRNIILKISFFSILAGSLAIIYYSFIVLKPFYRIRKNLVTDQNTNMKSNLTLETFFLELIQDHKHLTLKVNDNRKELRKKFLWDIIQERIDHAERKRFWDEYFIEWGELPFFMLYISFDRYHEWLHKMKEEDFYVVKAFTAQYIEKAFSEQYKYEGIEMSKDSMTFILQPNDPEASFEFEHKLREVLDSLHHSLQRTLTIGVGDVCNDYTTIRNTYEQAKLASSFRFYEGYSSVIYYDHIPKAHKDGGKDLDLKWIDELVERMNTGNEEFTLKQLDQIFKYIIESEVAPYDAQKFIHQMIDSIESEVENRMKSSMQVQQIFDIAVDSMFIHDIRQQLTNWLRSVVVIFEVKSDMTKDQESVDRMIQYMHVNLSANIGVQEIADAVGVSVSTASQLFKNEMNDTLYGYLKQLRIKKAEQLLRTTDSKIADIAVQVGYQNENSFIRTFRKINNITPGKYRDIIR